MITRRTFGAWIAGLLAGGGAAQQLESDLPLPGPKAEPRPRAKGLAGEPWTEVYAMPGQFGHISLLTLVFQMAGRTNDRPFRLYWGNVVLCAEVAWYQVGGEWRLVVSFVPRRGGYGFVDAGENSPPLDPAFDKYRLYPVADFGGMMERAGLTPDKRIA